jgi:sugar transferase EpsL
MKRSMDVLGAGFGLVLFGPLIVAIAGALAISEGRPIFFRQERAGLHGRPFAILKFRTMRAPRPDEMSIDADRRRVTSMGRRLRATSLDELPELWNVLRGEMSLVGPRPLLTAYLDRYTTEEGRRHEMRPGVTGWAVVHGRNALAFEDRLRLDVWYVDNWTIPLDIRIIASTVRQVLRREGVAVVQSAEGIDLPRRFHLDPTGWNDDGWRFSQVDTNDQP